MASAKQSKKLRILLIPFFATGHIGPHTELAVRLAVLPGPGAVEPTVAVTPANVAVVRSALERHSPAASSLVKIATYPFPRVDGLAPGVENLSAAGADGWRISAVAVDEALTRPAQEALLREQSPDAIVTDYHFFWNHVIAAGLGLPSVMFSVIGPFSLVAMNLLNDAVSDGGSASASESHDAAVPGLPGQEIRIPMTELPEFLRCPPKFKPCRLALTRCLGVAFNTFAELEQEYCEMFVRAGSSKRAYSVGPVSLPSPAAAAAAGGGISESPCIRWLDSKRSSSVVYVCFGTYAVVSSDQLRELALGLEASGQPFLWVVRTDAWAPPDGWAERVGRRGMMVRGWAPQTVILAHPALGSFLTPCGSSSLLEALNLSTG